MKNIMARAWEIKKEADRKMVNRALRMENRSELKDSEKAIFGECLKMAWAEAKKAEQVSKDLEISAENAQIIVAKESDLVEAGHCGIKWNVWSGYGRYRAYYTCEDRSKYANNKKDNFVELVA